MKVMAPVPSRGTVPRSFARPLLLACVTVVTVLGCSSTPVDLDRGGDWSRSYVLPYDRVWEAVKASLSKAGYWIEEEHRERGLVRAESTREPAYRAVVLVVRVDQREEEVRVNVQASGGGVDPASEIGRFERAVNEFLDELDGRLRQR